MDNLPASPAHLQTGRHGESVAADFLQSLGYQLRQRNVRIGNHDEIDIIAYDPADRVMVFCEVKTREKYSSTFVPDMNMTREKKANMARAARSWVHLNAWEEGYRMDLVCVMGNKVTGHYIDLEWPVRRR